MMNDNDFAQNRIHAKFQPVASPDIRFQEGDRTRFYLEYDGATGCFEEIIPLTGEVVATGRIEPPDRDVAGAIAACLMAVA